MSSLSPLLVDRSSWEYEDGRTCYETRYTVTGPSNKQTGQKPNMGHMYYATQYKKEDELHLKGCRTIRWRNRRWRAFLNSIPSIFFFFPSTTWTVLQTHIALLIICIVLLTSRFRAISPWWQLAIPRLPPSPRGYDRGYHRVPVTPDTEGVKGDLGIREGGGVFQKSRRIISIYVLFAFDCHLGPTGQCL